LEGLHEGIGAQVQVALDSGLEPMEIIQEALVPGMDIAGKKFEDGEYFLPHLLMAGKAMQAAMELLEPLLIEADQGLEQAGAVVLGTVEGDIHEIGKSLVGTMLTANGFTVHDLGVDVPVTRFVEVTRETGANVVGLSALLTTTMVVQKEIIEALEDSGLRERVKVIIGGAPVSQSWADEIGADGYADDALGAVRLTKELLGI
jgi:5-methyltetrahydrofolate--homocysteine methyltransferase